MNFKDEVNQRIRSYSNNTKLKNTAAEFLQQSIIDQYSYNFSWMGRPIIQYPQDIVAMQEIIWDIKPDLIIETGIAHGGSLIMSASMLALLEYADARTHGNQLNVSEPQRKVLGIDIDIREHNKKAIMQHPMSNRIVMFEGSSISDDIIQQVQEYATNHSTILVVLDSNHTHEHVLAELEAYAPLTTLNSYCVVFDTIIEDLPETALFDRDWGQGNNPKTAVKEYLKTHPEFEIDQTMDNKLGISVAPSGYLKRIA